MAIDVDSTLRTALETLRGEKTRIERRIAAIEAALDGAAGGEPQAPQAVRVAEEARGRPRKRMSPAARKAVSARMKAYWKTRQAAAKGRVKKSK